MKKTIILILLIFTQMIYADARLTSLDENTSILGTDIFYLVDDPGGTPKSEKITALNIFDMIDTFAELNTIVADKTLVNEEDAVTWDALGTFDLGAYFKNGAVAAGFIRIYEDSDDGGNYTHIQTIAQGGDITLTLPPDDGDAGEQLQTDGSGVLTWEAAGSFTSTAVDDTTWSDGSNATNTWTFDVSGTDHTMAAGNGLMTFGDAVTITDLLTANAGASFLQGATAAGFIKIYEDSDDGAHSTKIQAVAMAGDITLSLPPDDGDAGEQLQTDGSGVLTWEAAGGTATAWDDIADPDNSGLTTITFDNAELSLLTGDNDAAASFFILQNTDADHTGGNFYLLDLDYSADDGDVDADYIKCQDSGGVVFTVQEDGIVAGNSFSDGTATLTGGALTGLTTALTVAQGGTGATSLNDGFVLLGSNTAAITPLDVTTDGGIIIGDGTTDPVVLDVGSSTAITILGTVATGVWQGTVIDHERGGLEADVSSYSGLVAIASGSTAEVDSLDELEAQLADVTRLVSEAVMPVASEDPDVDAAGELSVDTDGANEPNDVVLRTIDGNGTQVALAQEQQSFQGTIIKPNDLADATRDKCMYWSNETGMSFVVTKIEAWADTDDTAFVIDEFDADGASNTVEVDALNCTTGTGPYTDTETTISNATIEADHTLFIDFDDTDDPGWVKISICGYFLSDVD